MNFFKSWENNSQNKVKLTYRQLRIDHGRKLIALALWGGIVGLVWGYAAVNGLSSGEMMQALIDLFETPAGVIIYILVYLIRPLLFFPATVITVIAGAIFGPIWGVVVVIFASNSSAMIAYVVGRYFSGEMFGIRDSEDDWVAIYKERLRQNSFEAVLIMRLIFLPYDLVNYLCGFLKIDWKPFLLATALGSIPGTIAFVLFGASIDISAGIAEPELNRSAIILSLIVIVISFSISRYLKGREVSYAPEPNR